MSASPPRIRVQAGKDVAHLETLHVNQQPVKISTSAFEGKVAVRIRDYHGPETDRSAVANPPADQWTVESDTWSIEIEGRFLQDVDADDIMWGNAWDHPIRDYLPYGTSAALKFVHHVDPSLSHDIYADRPWALSPFVSTMNFLSINKAGPDSSIDYSIPCKVKEDTTAILPSDAPADVRAGDAWKRRTYFAQESNRKGITLGKDVHFKADFCNGYIDFNTLSLKLPIRLTFPLAKYWDGQPVTFVLRKRNTEENYFIVTFTLDNVQPVGGPPAEQDKQPEREDGRADADVGGDQAQDVDELGVD